MLTRKKEPVSKYTVTYCIIIIQSVIPVIVGHNMVELDDWIKSMTIQFLLQSCLYWKINWIQA